MRWVRSGWKRFRWVLLGLLGLEFLVLSHPAVFFPHAVTAHGLTLRSDQPFDPEAGIRILAEVRTRLETSPLGQKPFTADICIANTPWRRRIFFAHQFGAIGMS